LPIGKGVPSPARQAKINTAIINVLASKKTSRHQHAADCETLQLPSFPVQVFPVEQTERPPRSGNGDHREITQQQNSD